MAQFNLPILNTNFAEIQKAPTSGLLQTLTSTFDTAGKLGTGIGEAADVIKADKNKTELEKLLNKPLEQESNIKILKDLEQKLINELAEAEVEEQKRIDFAKQQEELYKQKQAAAFDGSFTSKESDTESFTPVNQFGFTPKVLPQLRGF